MKQRITPSRKKQLLDKAQRIAQERATLFRTARRNGAGELLTGHKLHHVTSTRKRNNLIEKGARPVLSSREWAEIYREVGLA